MRNLCVSDLTKIAQIIKVASEGEHRPKHTMQFLVWPARANFTFGGRSNNYCQFDTLAWPMKSRQQNHTTNYLDLLLYERLWSVEVEVVRWLLHFIFSPFALKKLRIICQHSSADCKLGLAGQTMQRSERLQRWGHLGTYYREHRWFRLNIDVSEEVWLSSSVSGIYREHRWFRLNIDIL